MREFRVKGPPGCGKTTWTKRQVERAAKVYGASQIVVCSLTRAAAANIANTQPGIPPQQIGTIHSLAYKAVNAGKIAESSVDEWNAYCDEHGQPTMKLRGGASAPNVDEPRDDLMSPKADAMNPGDRDLAEMNRFRARMLNPRLWPDSVRSFAVMWNNWKREAGAMDFTDLLEIAYQTVDACPGNPSALFVDESQDCSKLMFALMRKWGEAKGCFVFTHVGDQDQILYRWAGVDPTAFDATSLPDNQRLTLHQSYRVPRAVHSLAVKWIDQTRNREPVHYLPRDFDGNVRRDIAGKFRDPMPAIRDSKRYTEQGKTVMFVATCSYMLEDVISALKAEGIAFHNPYRQSRGDWNPLARGKSKTTAVDRLLAFIRPNGSLMNSQPRQWTNREVWQWLNWIKVKETFQRGFKSTIELIAEENPDSPADVLHIAQSLLCEDHTWHCLDGNPEWYNAVIPEARQRQLEYPMKILAAGGATALELEPQTIVTTVHAVKGGEADAVYLFPDLSPQGHNEWMKGGDGREEVRRTFYVGMTRAREDLIICQPSSNMSVAF
jgi:superfamily I DNA/RNA helicase